MLFRAFDLSNGRSTEAVGGSEDGGRGDEGPSAGQPHSEVIENPDVGQPRSVEIRLSPVDNPRTHLAVIRGPTWVNAASGTFGRGSFVGIVVQFTNLIGLIVVIIIVEILSTRFRRR